MGIPLLYHNANLAGGDVKIESHIDMGTTIKAWFQLDNWDRPPVGDCADLMALIVSSNPNVRVIIKFLTDAGEYVVGSEEICEALGGVVVNPPEVIPFLKEMFIENLAEIKFED